jgi:NAD(P)-dependent dehydrogenase (short-subunit alcohol dehydrogenase family)
MAKKTGQVEKEAAASRRPPRLASRSIVLTGCTRGLGRALAEKFAALGHQVIGCGRDEAALAELRAELGEPHAFDAIDVTDEAAVAAWASRTLARCGPPHLLVNNAAVMNRPAAFWEVPAEEFERMLAVNLAGLAHVIRHFVPAMVERSSGVIVNFSSEWGRSTSPEVAPYCATKWAVEGLTRSLAQELPHGMAAVPVNPGIIDTDMLRLCFGAAASNYPGPARWAETAAPFLLSLGPADNGQPRSVPDA